MLLSTSSLAWGFNFFLVCYYCSVRETHVWTGNSSTSFEARLRVDECSPRFRDGRQPYCIYCFLDSFQNALAIPSFYARYNWLAPALSFLSYTTLEILVRPGYELMLLSPQSASRSFVPCTYSPKHVVPNLST